MGKNEDDGREQDRILPIANVARIMKRALPENAKIAKEAKECVQECVSEFISFVTSEASDKCLKDKRKTIGGDDILFAMQSLGFDNYNQTLKLYMEKYREATKIERAKADDEMPGVVGQPSLQTNQASLQMYHQMQHQQQQQEHEQHH